MTDESRWLQGNRIVNFAWHAFWWMFVYPTLLKHVWTFREATNFWNIPLKKLGDSMTPHRLKVVAYCPWVSLRGPPSLHQFRVRKWHAGCKFQHGWGSRTGTHLKASMGTPFRMKVQRESVFRHEIFFYLQISSIVLLGGWPEWFWSSKSIVLKKSGGIGKVSAGVHWKPMQCSMFIISLL